MSDYRYETNNERLDIKTSADPRSVFMWVHEGRNQAAILVSNADAPTVAAEILKAAGRDDLAALIESAAREAVEKAEAEAAEKKLKERRDALASDLTGDDTLRYEHIRSSLRKAINRIIELEDGASRD